MEIPGSVTSPRGYKASAVHCGLKRDKSKPDIGLLVSEVPAVAAGTFTTSDLVGAHVGVCRRHLRGGKAQAIAVNAGNANAFTGPGGIADAERMAKTVAEELGLPQEYALVASTGVTGRPLPMDTVLAGIKEAAANLASGREVGHNFARAIMTTDTKPKEVVVQVAVGDIEGIVAGAAKGAGMIAPRMATMLAFLATDLRVPLGTLSDALKEAARVSFNRITVDSHRSPNDTLIMLANGASGGPWVEQNTPQAAKFTDGVLYVASRLAEMIVRDAEGASKFIEVRVTGASTEAQAEQVAREVASSPLVKAAVHGGDPNWGRILSAAANAGAGTDPGKISVQIGTVRVFEKGAPKPEVAGAAVRQQMLGEDVLVWLDLGLGNQRASVWTCDLSEEYVTINAEYET